jgi:hypothetical protein
LDNTVADPHSVRSQDPDPDLERKKIHTKNKKIKDNYRNSCFGELNGLLARSLEA